MSDSFQNLLRNQAAAIARALLFFGAGYLYVAGQYICTNIISDDAEGSKAKIVAGITFLCTSAWSLWLQWRHNKKVDTALQLPAGSSREKLNANI
jgi:hypothetical protein